MEHWLVKDGACLAYLTPRPDYCDRGRWHALVEAAGVWHSDADPWPRYYFDLERGKAEVVEYLKAKKVDVEGAEWVERNAYVGEAMKAFSRWVEGK